MLKVSTKGRYGLRTLMDIAVFQSNGPVTLHDISLRQGVSEKYLWQIVSPLKTAGILKMSRGKNGGCVLAKHLGEITMLDLLCALEGPLSIIDDLQGEEDSERHGSSVTRKVWEKLNDDIRKLLAGITIADVVREYQETLSIPNYVI